MRDWEIIFVDCGEFKRFVASGDLCSMIQDAKEKGVWDWNIVSIRRVVKDV